MDISGMSPRTRVLFNISFVGMIVGMPFLTWYFAITFIHYDAALTWPDAAFWSHIEPPSVASVGFYLLWVAFQAVLAARLPGRIAEGAPLPDGRRLDYRLNGLLSLGLTVGVAVAAVWRGLLSPSLLFDQWGAGAGIGGRPACGRHRSGRSVRRSLYRSNRSAGPGWK